MDKALFNKRLDEMLRECTKYITLNFNLEDSNFTYCLVITRQGRLQIKLSNLKQIAGITGGRMFGFSTNVVSIPVRSYVATKLIYQGFIDNLLDLNQHSLFSKYHLQENEVELNLVFSSMIDFVKFQPAYPNKSCRFVHL